uniref:receptor protein-tyrosine kinase n=1 Tax=Culex tarsalis TaxID=7177 RepID=A0A1Q3FM28_CULTA
MMRRPSLISWMIVIHMVASCCGDVTAEFIRKPTIIPSNGLFLQPGESGKLTCQVNVSADMRIDMWWENKDKTRILPSSKISIGPVTETLDVANLQRKVGQIEVTIQTVELNDNGEKYTCRVRNQEEESHTNYRSIEVTVGNDIWFESPPKINVTTGRRPLKIDIKYRAFPQPVFYWTKDGSDVPLKSDLKYNLSESNFKTTLVISNPTVEDAGIYVLHGDNGFVKRNLSIKVFVRGKPILTMEPVYVKPSEQASFTCTCVGYPKPTINFAFFACDDVPWTNCSKEVLRNQINQFGTQTSNTKEYIKIEHFIIPKATTAGYVVCAAENSEGSAMVQADLLIGDPLEPVLIRRDSSGFQVVTGDRVAIICSASVYKHTDEIEFLWNGTLVMENKEITFQDSYENYAYVRKLVIEKAQKSHEGLLKCRTKTNKAKVEESKEIQLEIFEPMKPRIFGESDHEEITQNAGESCQLNCYSKGIPKPSIEWIKNGEPFENDTRVQVINGTTLFFTYLKREDSGQYHCRVQNREGQAEKAWTLTVTSDIVEKTWIYAGLAMLIVLILIVILITMFYCKKKKEVAAMRKAGLVSFAEGYKGQLNPELPLGAQTDLLPYDIRYEFPAEKLKLGKTLGAGAFGVVMMATAQGLVPDEKETTVAVKMVRKQTDNIVMRALISELKIMIHLGPHPNVVNLLGAITKNVVKRELMVIVEYCPYGNLQDYLMKHRRTFLDQFSEIDGSLDYNWQNKKSGINSQYLNNSNNNTGSEVSSNPTNSTYISNNSNYITQPGSDFKKPLSNIKHTMIEEDEPKPTTVTTTDLISWSAQIASGMEYLAHRLVIHGDLAARNVLLSENNVVKICDFGLARSIYHRNDNYRKKGSDPLPFKWLALESIEHADFSTKSDVWSYGILLWELFSLATNPYPGMEISKELVDKLRQGYRMDKPPYANKAIYEVMRKCWKERPTSRPTFWELKAIFSNMLPDHLRSPTEFNDQPYLKANNVQGGPNYVMNVKPPPKVAPPPVPQEYMNMKGSIAPRTEQDGISMEPLDQQTNANDCESIIVEDLGGLSPRSAISNPGYVSAVNVKSL